MTMDDLVFVQVFCPDVSLYDKFNSAYRSYFGKEYPARAFVGSGSLLRGGHFEMLGIAVKRQAPQPLQRRVVRPSLPGLRLAVDHSIGIGYSFRFQAIPRL